MITVIVEKERVKTSVKYYLAEIYEKWINIVSVSEYKRKRKSENHVIVARSVSVGVFVLPRKAFVRCIASMQ